MTWLLSSPSCSRAFWSASFAFNFTRSTCFVLRFDTDRNRRRGRLVTSFRFSAIFPRASSPRTISSFASRSPSSATRRSTSSLASLDGNVVRPPMSSEPISDLTERKVFAGSDSFDFFFCRKRVLLELSYACKSVSHALVWKEAARTYEKIVRQKGTCGIAESRSASNRQFRSLFCL